MTVMVIIIAFYGTAHLLRWVLSILQKKSPKRDITKPKYLSYI